MEAYIVGEKEISVLEVKILEETDDGFKELYKVYENDMINAQELYHERPRVYQTEQGLICTDGIKTIKREIALRHEKVNVILWRAEYKEALLIRLAAIEKNFKISNIDKAKIYHYLRNIKEIRTVEIATAIRKTVQFVFQRLDMALYPANLLLALEKNVITFSDARDKYRLMLKYENHEYVINSINKTLERNNIPSPELTVKSIRSGSTNSQQ